MTLKNEQSDASAESVNTIFQKQSKKISINQYNIELAEAQIRIDRGDFISHDDLKKETQEW